MSFKNLLAECFGEKSELDEATLYVYGLAYFLKGINAYQFQHWAKPYCTHLSARSVRLVLKNSKYVLPIKLFVLSFLRRPNGNIKTAISCAQRFGISQDDAELIYHALKDVDWLRKAAEKFAAKIPQGHTHESLEGIHYTFEQVLPSLTKHIRAITWRKLRFLADAGTNPLSHYWSELHEQAVRAYYQLAPTKQSEAYVRNYLKRSITNYATNIIKSETSQCRARIERADITSNGESRFLYNEVSVNQVVAGEAVEIEGDDGGESINRFEMQFSIYEVLTRYKKTSRKYRLLLLLLSASEDQEFSAWLHSKGFPVSKDHCEIQTELKPDEYLALVSEFLGASYKKVEAFLSSLKQELGEVCYQ